MHTRFKALSTVLAAALTMSVFSVMVAAEPDRTVVARGETGDDDYNIYDWVFYSDKTLEIKDTDNIGSLNLYDYTFPKEVVKEVTSIVYDISDFDREYSYYLEINDSLSPDNFMSNLESISITGKGIENVSGLGFSSCHFDLKSFSVPEGTHIADLSVGYCDFTSLEFLKDFDYSTLSVFGCDSLKEIIVPDCSESTGYHVSVHISRCENLSNVSVSGKVKDLSVRTCPNLETITIPEIRDSLNLYNNGKLSEIVLPDGDYRGTITNASIKEMTYPASANVRYIGDSLEKANVISGRKAISEYMFSSCGNLTSVNIPNGVTSIEYGAFSGCYSLKSIDLPSTIKKIDSLAFRRTGLESVSIPFGVSTIEYGTFKDCKSLASVYLPYSVKSIHLESFKGCSSLKDVYYSGSQDMWNKIAVSDGGSLSDVFGNAEIHFAESVIWAKAGDNWTCENINGDRLKGWQQINKANMLSDDGSWYYFDKDGILQKGWLQSGSSWYFMGDTGAMTTGWVQSGSKWYFMDEETGKMVANDWVESDGNYYFMSGSGAMATGWIQSSETWYYLNAAGTMVKNGWVQSGKAWYYMSASGAMATGWVQSGKAWYYMSSSGAMATGWIEDGGSRYYMGPSGAMATGWIKDGDNWYYLRPSGVIHIGWLQSGSTWYYMDSKGVMVSGIQKIDNRYHEFDSNGKWIDYYNGAK